MAVYERRYRGYDGPETPTRTRFLILPRYAYENLFASKAFLVFLCVCVLWPVGSLIRIYLTNNLSLLASIGIQLPEEAFAIGPSFFLWFLYVQGLMLGFIMTMIVGPGVVSPDLHNNALPLYLVRPFSKWEYVLGKFCVIGILLSTITWIPGLLLFAIHATMADSAWLSANWTMAPAIVIASLILIAVYGLLALAISATVKWRPVAAAVFFALFLMGFPLSLAINTTLGTTLGGLFNISQMLQTVWESLFGVQVANDEVVAVSTPLSWLGLAALCATCLLVLARKVRAYEVVR